MYSSTIINDCYDFDTFITAEDYVEAAKWAKEVWEGDDVFIESIQEVASFNKFWVVRLKKGDYKMRVTRAIRDYVEKRVYDEYEKAKRELRKDYEERVEKAKEEIEKILESDVIERINMVLGFYGMEQIKAEDAFYRIYVSVQNRKDESELNEKRKKIYNSAGDKVTEILATLELGRTKEDLDKMLSEIKFWYWLYWTVSIY